MKKPRTAAFSTEHKMLRRKIELRINAHRHEWKRKHPIGCVPDILSMFAVFQDLRIWPAMIRVDWRRFAVKSFHLRFRVGGCALRTINDHAMIG